MLRAMVSALCLLLLVAPPDTTSSASPKSDPNDKTKTWKPYAASRARTRAHARMKAVKDAPVYVIESRDPRAAGRRICEQTVPKRPADTPILLKPNLSGINRLKRGIDNGLELRTTGIEFLRGVIHCLKARGHTRITVTEAWSRTKQQTRWMKTSGLDRLLAEEKVKWVGMWDEGMLYARLPKAKRLKKGLLVPRLLARHLDKGLYISVPRMKMHRFAVMSLGIKNGMGFVYLDGATPEKSRRGGMHQEIGPWLRRFKRQQIDDRKAYARALERFAERLIDVLEAELPHVVLIDGVPPVAGDGFALIEPLDEGVAIGSENVIAAEAVGMEYMGYLDNAALEKEQGHRTSPILTEAARRFFGTTDVIHGVKVTGFDAWRKWSRVAHFRAFPKFEVGDSKSAELPWVARALKAKRTKKPPVLDGRLDDDVWEAAARIELTTDWGGSPAGPETVARLAWDRDSLYLAFDCAFESLSAPEGPPSEEHRKLYRYEVVELFVDPTPKSRHTYLEIELGPKGHYLDISVNRKKRPRGDVAWESGVTYKAAIDSQRKRYVIEARIPAAAFGSKTLSPGDWRIGLYRISGTKPDRIYQARFPTRTKKPNFHVPDAFGWLRLVK